MSRFLLGVAVGMALTAIVFIVRVSMFAHALASGKR